MINFALKLGNKFTMQLLHDILANSGGVYKKLNKKWLQNKQKFLLE